MSDGVLFIRLLRVLRIFYVFESIKQVFEAIVLTMPRLTNHIFSIFLIMIFYAIIGLHLYAGVTEYRCRTQPLPNDDGSWPIFPDYEYLCGYVECPAE